MGSGVLISRAQHRRPIAALLLAGLAAACGPPDPPRDVNLLLVSVDTLRADRLGSYGNREWGQSPSPRLDSLASEGVLFETVYAPRGQTHPSLAAMLTGKYPITTGVRENGYPLPAVHRTLFEFLQEAGFQTGIFVANMEVEHEMEEWVARGADVAADGSGGRRGQQLKKHPESKLQAEWDERVELAARAFIDRVDKDRPFALWAHFYDVHKPYNPPARHLQRFGAAAGLPKALQAPGPDSANALEIYLANITLGDREVGEAELRRIRGLYDATVLATDERFGRLLDALEAIGELENTYVLFTSDHGEELFDHNRYFFHGGSIYDGVVRLPLVLTGPELPRGLRLPDLTRNIDIAPTVLDLLGLPLDETMEGQSLVGLMRGEGTAPDHAVVEWQDLVYAVTDGRHKLVWNPRHVHTRKSPYGLPGMPADRGFRIDCIEAYDLEADPLEQVNLLADFDFDTLANGDGLPKAFRPLFRKLRDWLADPTHEREMDLDTLTDAQRERLKQIGYVSSVSENRGDSVRREPCVER